MAKKISASVGKGGKNNPDDTKVVQELLNGFTKLCGFKKLDTDGVVGSKTISAIAEFQKSAVGMSRPDSRIDPGGPSFKTLIAGPKKAEAELKKAEQAEKEKKEAKQAAKDEKDAPKKEAKPQVKGDTRGLEKKILAVLEAVSSHFGKPIYVETANQKASFDGKYLWQKWEGKLKRGAGVPGLGRDLRENLDKLYNDSKQDEFFRLVDKNSSNLNGGGSSGKIVNTRKTGRDLVDVLSTYFDKEGDSLSLVESRNLPSKITDDMKKKWG